MTHKIKRAAQAVAISCLFILGGCASNLPALPSTEAVNPEYLIGPGDAINIIVWRNPEVSMSVPVRPDGKITTPTATVFGAVAFKKVVDELQRKRVDA